MGKFAEQIAAYEAKRGAIFKSMEDIMDKAGTEGATLDASQQEAYDGHEADIAAIDGHLKRLKALEDTTASTAVPVTGATAKEGVESRQNIRVEVKGANIPKGIRFTRYAMALAAGKGSLMQALEISKKWDDSTPEVGTVLKAAVAAGTTTDPTWAKPLVEYQNMASEFAELLRPATIIGRIPGLRNVPFNIKVPRQTGGSSAQWVGQGAPKPVSSMAFDQISLGMAKVAGIVVITDELARASAPSAEALVQNDLRDAVVALIDRDFVDPAKALVAEVSPASITNGVTPIQSSGNTADHVRADTRAALAAFIGANLSVAGGVWIMRETTFLAMSLMVNALGQPEFPELLTKGTWQGLPIIQSENIPAEPGSPGPPVIPAGDRIILAKASEIMLADDGEVMLSASSEASLQMDSAPTNPPAAATVMVSLWQMNLLGIRAERFINWAKRRPTAVVWINSVNYGE